jgi:sugar fermentation stimulation protein A
MYKNIVQGTFVERPNRFIAKVVIDGTEETVHVKNTGRCRELLLPGAKVYLEPASRERKTKWSLIGVKKGDRIVNIDSQAPNKVIETALNSGILKLPGAGIINTLKREKTYRSSRFDFYFETANQKGFLEVKGVTLENDGIAAFPDAPTERGTRHVHELMLAVDEGYLCYIIFVIQMKGIKRFEPNAATDPLFAGTLKKAAANGVGIIAFDCNVGPDFIVMDEYIDVRL